MTKKHLSSYYEAKFSKVDDMDALKFGPEVHIIKTYCAPSAGGYYTLSDMVTAYKLGRDHAWHLERGEEVSDV